MPDICFATIISDCDKRLIAAEIVLDTSIIRTYCCFHLLGDFHRQWNCFDGLFWSITKLHTSTKYEEHLAELQKCNTAAAQYLQKISAQFWVKAFFPESRYSYPTFNIVE